MINFDYSGKFTHLSILVPIEAELGLAQPQLVLCYFVLFIYDYVNLETSFTAKASLHRLQILEYVINHTKVFWCCCTILSFSFHNSLIFWLSRYFQIRFLSTPAYDSLQLYHLEAYYLLHCTSILLSVFSLWLYE